MIARRPHAPRRPSAPRPDTSDRPAPVYPIGTRVQASNDAGEIEHQAAIVVDRIWIPVGEPVRIRSAAHGPRPGRAPFSSWLYELEAAQGRWYAERRLRPIGDDDDAGRRTARARRRTPSAPVPA